MTRQQVIDIANRRRIQRGAPPLRSRDFTKAVAYCRRWGLVSEEYLEWARLGYFPTPSERIRR